ncbi:MAG: SDR family oxidoreductase [Pseudomonadales bacterium]
MKLFDLEGRVAIVTGGNAGIGLGLAEGLAQAGAKVMICGRRAEANSVAVERLEATGAEIASLEVDVTSHDDLHRLFNMTRKALGPVDILVNNAGIHRGSPPESFPLEDWQAVMNTNLNQVVNCCQLAFEDLAGAADRGFNGKIINIGSMYSLFGSPNSIAYAASKGGIVQLTKSLAAAWAQHAINVNAILPGWIETEMTAPIGEMPEMLSQIHNRTPFKRMGAIEEMAGAAVFLAAAASDFVTGISLPVDGGYSIG